MQLHEQQKRILVFKDTNELVSAGAGSGKTTIMTHKIANMLLEKKVLPENLLVLTFTNLAAAEMKTKIINNISESYDSYDDKEYLTELLDKLTTADISTIDSFCNRTLKKYFYAIGLDKEINIMPSKISNFYQKQAFSKTVESYVDTPSDLDTLLDLFTDNSRDYSTLFALCKNTMSYIQIQLDPDSWIQNILNEYTTDLTHSNTAKFLKEYINKNLKNLILSCEKYYPYLEDQPTLINRLDDFIITSKKIIDIPDINEKLENLNVLYNIDFKGLKILEHNKQYYEYIMTTVNFIKSKRLKEKLGDIDTNIDLTEIIDFTKNILGKYLDFVKAFMSNYNEIKSKKRLYDFTDIKLLMLKLLENTEIKTALQNNYHYIFVDEYQDVNDMDINIIRQLSNGKNLFLVGDIKQSIYGFRLANPQQFMALYDEYRGKGDGVVEDMNINYRANPAILKFVDTVFSFAMTKDIAEIDYKNTSIFSPQREDFPKDDANVEINIFQKSGREESAESAPVYSVLADNNSSFEFKDTKKMCISIAEKIKALVNTDFYDANIKKNRKLNFSDICILTRSLDNDIKTLVHTLDQSGIPVGVERKSALSDSESLRMLGDILQVINFSTTDVCWATYMTRMSNFTYDELAKISSIKGAKFFDKIISFESRNDTLIFDKIQVMMSELEDIRSSVCNKNIKQLFEYLLYDKKLYQQLLGADNSELSSIQQFVSNISGDETDMTIQQFLQLLYHDEDFADENSFSSNADSVNIQTIHKSKGLEYPVVILFNAGKAFSNKSIIPTVLHSKNLGLGIDYFDIAGRVKFPSLNRRAISLQIRQKENAEELRLLYVALTRAKNFLYIYGIMSKTDINSFNPYDMNSYLKVITTAIKSNKAENNIDIAESIILNFIDSTDLSNIKTDENIKNTEDANNISISKLKSNKKNENNKNTDSDKKIFENYSESEKVKNTDIANIDLIKQLVDKNINFIYPHKDKFGILLKNNVTAITKTINEEHNIIPKFLKLNETIQTDFELAEIGTLYHRALETILATDISIDSFVSKYPVIDKDILTKNIEIINPLLADIKSIKKEAKFLLKIPYNDIYKDSKINDEIFVQGIVDLILEYENGITIIDYKYTNQNVESIKKTYVKQLELYKLACEKAFKKPVKNTYILSIKAQNLIKI